MYPYHPKRWYAYHTIWWYKKHGREEIKNDVLFVTERDSRVWWYDGQRIVFRTETYNKILRALQAENRATLAYLQKEVGVNRSALQKMLANLQEREYVERDVKVGWRVFITPSV